MSFHGSNNDFDTTNFPDLYPKNHQDMVNESYNHNKVLPRVEGMDYNNQIIDPAHEGNPDYSSEGTDNINNT